MSGTSLEELRRQLGRVVEFHLRGYSQRLQYARLDDKLFRDPISGFQRLRPYEALVVDSPLFQRLRGISQTGLAYLTYPSSIHTRFEHSINCLHLAERILQEFSTRGDKTPDVEWAEVRLAALLHDIGHCIFSHVSESFYRSFSELVSASKDELFADKRREIPAGEIVNYCILTCDEFNKHLWEPIVQRLRGSNSSYCYVEKISLECIADMVVGFEPGDCPERRWQTDIINGPLDVDKLDYLRRDAYFTGISLTVDIERLLPSLRKVRPKAEKPCSHELRLAVDHRGMAVVEQLLFARMMLYDSVYHHHKVRAASVLLLKILRKHRSAKAWPTRSQRLSSVADLLQIDEYDFFGHSYPERVWKESRRLRFRELPERALVILPRALVNEESSQRWLSRYADRVNAEHDPVAQEKWAKFCSKFEAGVLKYARKNGAKRIRTEDFAIDVPEPPKFTRLGKDTLIEMAPDYAVPLSELFPFEKAVTNYTNQYKYRSYVFAAERFKEQVAKAAYKALLDQGIELNDLAFIMAHREVPKDVPDWKKCFYAPGPEPAKGPA